MVGREWWGEGVKHSILEAVSMDTGPMAKNTN